MYMVDLITCYCYMMLRKFGYAEWNAKNTAIINSSVVLFFIFTASLDFFYCLSLLTYYKSFIFILKRDMY